MTTFDVDLSVDCPSLGSPTRVKGTVRQREEQRGMPPIGELIVGFLQRLDPEEINRLSLERVSGLGGPSPAEAIMDVLCDIATSVSPVRSNGAG